MAIYFCLACDRVLPPPAKWCDAACEAAGNRYQRPKPGPKRARASRRRATPARPQVATVEMAGKRVVVVDCTEIGVVWRDPADGRWSFDPAGSFGPARSWPTEQDATDALVAHVRSQ